MSSEIYREMILEHYKNPRNMGVVSEPDATAADSNQSCGDVVEIQIKFNGGGVEDVKFQGHGCAISQAYTDMLIDMIKNKRIEDAVGITHEDLLKEIGIELSPMRLKCALLGMKVLKTAIYNYVGEKAE